ncbi:peptidoglycan-binding protein [Streptomyces sp. NPDC015350]|uniref:peptidoglycan-binding domain-containing protein n=1 Tax=Streptomyces sp. NPDC015350 TaxID=3364955 RepID=UPI0036FE0541
MTAQQHPWHRPGNHPHPPHRDDTAHHGANPVLGRVAPPDSTADTIEQEILDLFADPVPAAPAPVRPSEAAEGEPGPRGRGPRIGAGAFGRVLALVAATAAGSSAVLMGVSAASGPDRPPTARRIAVPLTTPPAEERRVAGADEEAPTRFTDPEPTRSTIAPTTPGTPPPAPSRTPDPGTSDAGAPSAGATPERSRPPDDGAPALGGSGPQVTELQWRLARLALYNGPYDGVFSAAVEDAVLRFQRTRGLDDPGGVHGAATREALRAETDGNGPDR